MADTVSHALVRFLKDKTHSVVIIDVQNIKEFKRDLPIDSFDFIADHIYYGKAKVKSAYEPVSIFALGSQADLQVMKEKQQAQMRRFKYHKFDANDFRQNVVDSSFEDLKGNNESESDDDDDDLDSDATDISDDKQPESALSPSLLSKPKRRLKKKSSKRGKISDSSTDHESDENSEKKQERKEMAEKREKLEQESILQSKMEILQSSNNLRMPGSSQEILPDDIFENFNKNDDPNMPGTSKGSDASIEYVSLRLKKLDEENERLKKKLVEKENNISQFRKAKKRLAYDDEDEYKLAMDNDASIPRKKVIKKNVPDDDSILSDSSPVKKQPEVQNEFRKFEKWVQIINNQEVEMIYLGRNTSIQLSKWRECKKAKTISLFVKNLARVLWGADKLANRFLKETDNIKKLSNRASPRKIVTPEKVNLLTECLRFFLMKIKPSLVQTDVESELSKIRSYLSEEIAYQLRQQKANLRNQA